MTVEEIIKRLDNYKIAFGDLYLYEASPKRRIPFYPPSSKEIHKKIPFDGSTGNVHMLPFDVEIAESCSNEIHNKLYAIKVEVEKQIKEKYKEKIKRNPLKKDGSMFDGTDYEQAKYLFSYLRVYGKNTNYDLTGIRFFFDQNDQVNCILLRFQIEICGSKSNRREDIPEIKKYPDTPYDGEGNECYHNLDMNIDSTAEDIAKAFLDFVLKKEAENM